MCSSCLLQQQQQLRSSWAASMCMVLAHTQVASAIASVPLVCWHAMAGLGTWQLLIKSFDKTIAEEVTQYVMAVRPWMLQQTGLHTLYS